MCLLDGATHGIHAAWAISMLATISPGPSLLAVMQTAMQAGRRASVALALGVSCGALTWGMLVTFGLSTLLVSGPGTLKMVHVLGALYLLILSARAFDSAIWGRATAGGVAVGRDPRTCFLCGWAIHLSNPNVVLSWIVVVAVGLRPGADMIRAPALAILAGAVTFAGFFYTLAAIVFSVPSVAYVYKQSRRIADTGLGIFFLFAAWRVVA
jgi:threonine/homoserine/homoserine lactone efflux protein